MAEVLGLIPARLNSKAIPGKSLVPLAGRPLIDYTFAAALEARSLTRIVVSTDAPDVASFARARGIEVPFVRPGELAGDETPMIDVIRHARAWLRDTEAYEPELVVLLQPTSPLRRGSDIDGTVARLMAAGADVAVSTVPVPHQFVPESVMVERDGWLVPFSPAGGALRRQDKRAYQARNGPAVLALRAAYIDRCVHLYEGRVVGYPMDRRRSIDIDVMEDLQDAADWLCRVNGDAGRERH